MEKHTIYELMGFLLAFLGLGVAYFAIYFGSRQERLKRELEHKERMMALEMGRSLPGDIPWLSPLRRRLPHGHGRAPWRVRIRLPGAAKPAAFRRTSGRQPASSAFSPLVSGTVVACVASVKQSSTEPTHCGAGR